MTKRRRPETGDHLERPGEPGAVPVPEHDVDIPAAPATSPPEAPVVPSDSAIAEFWADYGPTMLLVGAGLIIVLLLLYSL